MKKPRFVYAVAFCMLLFLEILIGLFVHDDFIRPYIGDVLVTVLICCLCRIIIPKGVSALPIYVFAFAMLVEIGQYFELVKVLGLEDNAFISTIVGTTFSVMDLVCYAVGCIAFWATEKAIYIKMNLISKLIH